jgi:coatomer protein complex subunit gamma
MTEINSSYGAETGKKKDEDDDLDYSPFWGIEKGAVLQEARCFNDSQLDSRKCQQVITKLLYLCIQGDSFTRTEATEVFFSVTKLFQSRDSNLRRMVYLIIKEICPCADEVIIVTSSLMKDMNSKTELYRANAIRVLCSITDTSLLGQIERYLKQAVVDKSSVVSSAALVSGFHLLKMNADIVKRWSNEVQEAINSNQHFVQFHALALLHRIKQSDRLAITKLVSTLTKSNIRAPLAQCLVIRYVSQVISDSTVNESSGERPFFDFLESCLRNKSEMVVLEAARAISELKDVTSTELQPAINVLQLFLSSLKPTLRFAAVRSLNKIALKQPMVVTCCNVDMEALITDQNRSVATLAITTLLKTGNESSVEKLMKQIGTFMSDIQDEFKIVVVEAIQSMCLKYPKKYRTLMNFLSNILREEGGFEYKKCIVNSITCLIRSIPEAKESGLLHLSEFIEDCEFTYLSSQILYLLGKEGPKTEDPSRYIRYIYNRVILENATIRASAVSALAKFALFCPTLRSRISILLQRCLHDNDDEVRDRATFLLTSLVSLHQSESRLIDTRYNVLGSYEYSLNSYVFSDCASRFTIDDIRALSIPDETQKRDFETNFENKVDRGTCNSSEKNTLSIEILNNPIFSNYGPVFKSNGPLELTEAETEYKVECYKHIFSEHIVFQFQCTNTISEQILENVSVHMEPISDCHSFKEDFTVPLDNMPLSRPGSTFVSFSFMKDFSAAQYSCVLKFISKEIDPTTGEPEEEGYEDEYTLEDVSIELADYIKPLVVSNFKKAWDEYEEASEQVNEYSLERNNNIQGIVETVMQAINLRACEGTEIVPTNARSHTTLLSGKFIGDKPVLVRLSMGVDASEEITMKVSVRGQNVQMTSRIHEIISFS